MNAIERAAEPGVFSLLDDWAAVVGREVGVFVDKYLAAADADDAGNRAVAIWWVGEEKDSCWIDLVDFKGCEIRVHQFM